ncbi:MAG: ArsR/SmtB family transcription factor [Solirubrobacterales bacterium]
MATETQPDLVDPRLLKALSHPTRVLILDILGRGPSSPVRITRALENVSLNLVSHHIKVLRELGCVELIETAQRRGATEHIYRAARWTVLTDAQWAQIAAKDRLPITTNVLRSISADTNRALAEGTMDERFDNHISRSPVELDEEGWKEVVEALENALGAVFEADARSAERARASGEELMSARVMIMQFLIGRDSPQEDDDA